MRRKLLTFSLAAASLYLLATAGLYLAMRQSPERFGALMAHVPMPAMIVLPFEPLWLHARSGSLAVNDPAPDFTLPTLDHASAVTLSNEWRARPVVLIFGSYT